MMLLKFGIKTLEAVHLGCVCVCVCVCMRICMHIHTCIRGYMCVIIITVCVYVCVFACAHIDTPIPSHTTVTHISYFLLYMYLYICIYIYVHIYRFLHVPNKLTVTVMHVCMYTTNITTVTFL